MRDVTEVSDSSVNFTGTVALNPVLRPFINQAIDASLALAGEAAKHSSTVALDGTKYQSCTPVGHKSVDAAVPLIAATSKILIDKAAK